MTVDGLPDQIAAKRQLLKELDTKRHGIESQMEALEDVLKSHGVGMHEPLVDAEGYPRADIDVYQVRHARADIHRLKTDHKEVMQQIEKDLFALHDLLQKEKA